MIHAPLGATLLRVRQTCPACHGRGTDATDRRICSTCDGERLVVVSPIRQEAARV
jgi:DnaJ-class molecular chaperone